MTKKDYEAIALVFQACYPCSSGKALQEWHLLRNKVADMLQRDNAAFKYDRFITACVPGANVKARTQPKGAIT